MIDRFRAWMSEQKLEAAYLTSPATIAYLTGFRTDPHERLMALAVTPDNAHLVVPGLEKDSAEAAARGVKVLAWRDGEDPYVLVRAALESTGRLAVEKEWLSLAAGERVRERLGVQELVDAGEKLRSMRVVKTPEEQDQLARAAAITDQVTEQILELISVGQTEMEISVRLSMLVSLAEATLSFESIVQTGSNSAMPHLRPTGRKLMAGDLVLLDFGAAYQGYRADITRMAVIGEPDNRQLEMHHLVLAANNAAVNAVRAGTTVGEVDRAARDVIEAAGLGDRFIHRVGHGIGLEAHEDPSLDPGSDLVLEEGMVITIEPGVYVPGWGGIRIEDDVVVEKTGRRLLTQSDRSLRAIPAR